MISRIVVVLPQPDSPTRPMVRPGWIENEMPSTARTVPIRRGKTAPFISGKCFVRSFTSTAGVTSGRSGGISPSASGRGKMSGRDSAPEAISSARMHAATWSAVAPWVTSSGSTSRHASIAMGQRAANGQPVGRFARDGGRPSRGTSRCEPAVCMFGTERSSPTV